MKSPFLPFLFAALLSCNSESSQPSPPGPENESGLGDEPIPADFTFQATRPVAVEVGTIAGGETDPAAQARVRLVVRTQNKDIIYRGSVIPGEAFQFDFPLAPDTTELEFTMIDDNGVETSQVVPVDPAQPGVSVTLGGAQ